jgi:hypothetical protein
MTISLWIRPRTCTHYIANDSCACEYSLKHTSGGIAHYAGIKEYKAQGLDLDSTEELELFINVANDYSDFFVLVWNVIF